MIYQCSVCENSEMQLLIVTYIVLIYIYIYIVWNGYSFPLQFEKNTCMFITLNKEDS